MIIEGVKDDIHIYRVRFPKRTTAEAVMPDLEGGYNIYIDERLDYMQAMREFDHAVTHIKERHFEYDGSIEELELTAHRVC